MQRRLSGGLFGVALIPMPSGAIVLWSKKHNSLSTGDSCTVRKRMEWASQKLLSPPGSMVSAGQDECERNAAIVDRGGTGVVVGKREAKSGCRE